MESLNWLNVINLFSRNSFSIPFNLSAISLRSLCREGSCWLKIVWKWWHFLWRGDHRALSLHFEQSVVLFLFKSQSFLHVLDLLNFILGLAQDFVSPPPQTSVLPWISLCLLQLPPPIFKVLLGRFGVILKSQLIIIKFLELCICLRCFMSQQVLWRYSSGAVSCPEHNSSRSETSCRHLQSFWEKSCDKTVHPKSCNKMENPVNVAKH